MQRSIPASPTEPHDAPPSLEGASRATEPLSLRLISELAKARLCALVLITTFVGFLLAAEQIALTPLLLTLVGVGLAAFGANALNQCWEADRDARMRRTENRPLPSGRMSTRQAWTVALVMALVGPIIVAMVSEYAALLTVLTQALYVLAYTPLKTITPHNTLLGAVVGALPPMIGWAAASNELGFGAWLLGAILFFWQIPHFLALAWLYRDDYARGGFRMLPLVDPDGWLTVRIVLVYTLALIPLTLSMTLAGLTGVFFAVSAVLLGLGFAWTAVTLARQRRREQARRLFLASVIYLPLLLMAMVADRRIAAALHDQRVEAVLTASTMQAAPSRD